MKDSFYTPTFLANSLISYISHKNVFNVADFCVGNGELLRAASVKWPKVKCFGSDISKMAITQTKERHPNWSLSKCDFLNKRSRNRILKAYNNNLFDLILMNPPFSCLGGTIHKVYLNDRLFRVSTAMAFLMYSLNFLSEKGSLYAIMPNSIAYSEKDKEAWNILVKNYNLNILNEPNEKYFKNCSPNIILVSLNNIGCFKKRSKSTKPKILNLPISTYSVF